MKDSRTVKQTKGVARIQKRKKLHIFDWKTLREKHLFQTYAQRNHIEIYRMRGRVLDSAASG